MATVIENVLLTLSADNFFSFPLPQDEEIQLFNKKKAAAQAAQAQAQQAVAQVAKEHLKGKKK